MSAIIFTQSALTDASVTPVASYTCNPHAQEFESSQALFNELLAAFVADKLPENLAEFKFSKLEGPLNYMYVCSANFDSSKILQSTKYTITRPAYDAPRFVFRSNQLYFDCRIPTEPEDFSPEKLSENTTIITPTKVIMQGITAVFKCGYDAESGLYTAPKTMNIYAVAKYKNSTTGQRCFETLEYIDDLKLPAPGPEPICRDQPYIKQVRYRVDQKGDPIHRGDFVVRTCHNIKMDPMTTFEVQWNKVTAPTGAEMPADDAISRMYDKYLWTTKIDEIERVSKLTWPERHSHVMNSLKCTADEASAVLYVDDVLGGVPFAMHQPVLRMRQADIMITIRLAFNRAALKP